MARHDNNSGTDTPVNADTTTTPADGTAAPAAVAEPKADSRHSKINVPQTDGTTKLVNRVDTMRGLWNGVKDGEAVGNLNPEGKLWERGDIARKISELSGKVVVYQVVNAAVKDQPKHVKAEVAAAVPPTTDTPANA